ncbi:MAG: DUF993 family protein [Planctomycetota bacterium]|nr:DUF993 family protein [Planctomycetota bacterium]
MIWNRKAYAAAHVVVQDEAGEVVDWEATDAQRTFLDTQGFGIAEAMDTAQRFDLGWGVAKTLMERTSALSLKNGFVAGASADQADPKSWKELAQAVAWQVNFIQDAGGLPVILPMPMLAEKQASSDVFVEVYEGILRESRGPVLLHWLGPMFLKDMEHYFPEKSFERIMALDTDRIVGAKISLLDAEREVSLRQSLALQGQVIYTGDDFHFSALIAGTGEGVGEYSHALLGILDGIARPASQAFQKLADGDHKEFLKIMKPCEDLSRHLFQAPTQHYKAGLAFLSWLDGRQENPWLPLRADKSRDEPYFQEIFKLALRAHVFLDEERATSRMHRF